MSLAEHATLTNNPVWHARFDWQAVMLALSGATPHRYRISKA